MNNDTAIGLAVFVLIILGGVLFSSAHRQKAQNEIRKALIEKFGSAQDLGAFLQSEGGQRFLEDLSAGMSSFSPGMGVGLPHSQKITGFVQSSS